MSEYKVEVKWTGGEDYQRMAKLTAESDNLPELVVVTPPEFKKGIPDFWSPEHLFVASAAICLFTTMMSISDGSKLNLVSLKVNGTGVLGKNENGKYVISRIDLYPVVEVLKESEVSKANKIIDKSERNCLISNSMTTEVVVHPDISVKQ
ncbi:MAG: OsmC family protein [Promethearchaeota archaeon]